ncbi:HAD-IIIA family hydrolase [bacterium]|nr:HAD-IIIA family hydrolase [bacterium]
MLSKSELAKRASKIKLVAFDVDGVMTDESLIFDENGVEYKKFNAKDGQGIVLLNNSGFKTAIITARQNGTVRVRFNILKMNDLYEGQKNKEEALDDLVKKYNLDYSQVAYMGDDLPDICILKKVGLSVTPQNGAKEVKAIVDFITEKSGGNGAVRELCDFLLENVEDKSTLCPLYLSTKV